MRNRSLMLLGILWALLPAALAAQVNVAGDWHVAFDRDQQSVQATMTLEQDGEVVTGVVANQNLNFEVECAIDGFDIRCAGKIDDGGEIIDVVLRGRIENGEITGAADYGPWGRGGWTATRGDSASLPVVTIDGPTVIMFWTSPDSVSDPEAGQALYTALDQQQTTMADTRDALRALGVVDVSQEGRQFRIRGGGEEEVFSASPDSSIVGYVLAAPGRDHRVLYRVQFTEGLLQAVQSFLGR